MTKRSSYDAVVVGSGPNGFAAAIHLQQQGLSVLLVEAKETTGGGLRSAALTLPGYTHDICSAIHPLMVASPFFSTLPLHEHGLEFIYPRYAAAHPFDNGSAAFLSKDIGETAASLGADGNTYKRLMEPLVHDWPSIVNDVLGPLTFPAHPAKMASFGWQALQPAQRFVRRFKEPGAAGLWGGMTAHAMLPLSAMATSAIGLVLMINAHRGGWPVARGGSQSIARALEQYFLSLGGHVQTGTEVSALEELPEAKAVLLDVTPRQLLKIGGGRLAPSYQRQLRRYRYGMGVCKVDWALDRPIPFANAACRLATTVHLGNSFDEIAASEEQAARGVHAEKPFVLLAQQSIVDPTRAPSGKHTAWAYCHVPHGSSRDMTEVIEKQVERFAPGFRDTILGRHTLTATGMEGYNPNYIGGDINGGAIDILQLFTRPVWKWRPYRTGAKGIYICSSSTPPGGGVHGMCGFHAARCALQDCF